METSDRPPMIRLLFASADAFSDEVFERVSAAGFTDLRPGHGCVFGNIETEGSRLTVLAQRANMTKQTVGEVATDLERLGYAERVPDPSDGRAKIIRLTERGRAAHEISREIIDDVEREWAERYGEERMAVVREALEAVIADRFGAAPVTVPSS